MDGALALASGFSVHRGMIEQEPGQTLGILGRLGVGTTDAHQRGDLLNAGRSRGLRLKAHGLVGRVAIAATRQAPTVIALHGKGTKHTVEGALTIVGFGPQRLLANGALEGLLGRHGLSGRAEDREHEFSGLSLQQFFQVPQGNAGSLHQVVEVNSGSLSPRFKKLIWDKRKVDPIRYHVYDT